MENEVTEETEEENDYNLFIESLELKFNEKYKNILRLKGKLLHESKFINIFFHVFINKNTDINPFEADIEMTIEFIENEAPYIQVMTNFLEPTIYDLKNYFLCLSKKANFVFDHKQMGKCQIIFNDIINNIQLFLYHLYNCEIFKTFIYFGEYNLNHIYHINNFLKNTEIIDFFRINRIENEHFYEKILYLILTELHIIVFEPENKNKSLGKILFYKKLSEISLSYEEVELSFNDKLKKKLKVSVKDTKDNILFKEIENKYIINDNIKILKIDYINKNEVNDKDNKKNEVKVASNSKTTYNTQTLNNFKKENDACYCFDFFFLNFNEKEDKQNNDLKDEYGLFKKFFMKMKIIVEKGYKSIISPYWLIFNNLINMNKDKFFLEQNKNEIKQIIEYDEKLLKKYGKKKNKIEKLIFNNAVKNIIFLCTEMTSCLVNDEDNNINFYVEKIKKYSIYDT